MDDGSVLAFRLARSGLARRDARDLAAAAACPASDVARDGALLALAARAEDVTRDGYRAAVDAGDVVVAHGIRGTLHAVSPADQALFGSALLAADDAELTDQLGQQVRRLAAEKGFTATAALAEVTAATRDALADGARLDKDAYHAALRARVRPDLMPWCRGCKSFHVAPMLWRYATVAAGVRLDADRRYLAGDPPPAPAPSDAVRRFLRWYGPARPADFAAWAGVARPHARRLWDAVAGELVQIGGGRSAPWVMREDVAALDAPPAAEGVRLLPAGDPYLQKPNRPALLPDPAVRKRFFRPVASPGAVLCDGRLAGLWRAKARGRRTEVAVEPLGPLDRDGLDAEAQRVARLRGADEAVVAVTA